MLRHRPAPLGLAIGDVVADVGILSIVVVVVVVVRTGIDDEVVDSWVVELVVVASALWVFTAPSQPSRGAAGLFCPLCK